MGSLRHVVVQGDREGMARGIGREGGREGGWREGWIEGRREDRGKKGGRERGVEGNREGRREERERADGDRSPWDQQKEPHKQKDVISGRRAEDSWSITVREAWIPAAPRLHPAGAARKPFFPQFNLPCVSERNLLVLFCSLLCF